MADRKGVITKSAKEIAKGLSDTGRLRESEYRASVDALNLFFGAIVGVNFAGLTDLSSADYAILLFITATLIGFILMVSKTTRRIWSAVQLTIFMAGYAWLGLVEKVIEGVDEKLVITLAVWTGAALLAEFTPRDPDPEPDA